ncbi:cell division protein FtsI (penicillin-binding protein 3) [Arcanobacterium wilhelmae]|uniref:Cell division protein FtsI (Penicillin-binding protein 3) n=1 Tax=Arcanobacterium wilhelmae TaxID=1803177 RepID=A0ABT9N979_9ACTO|nr:penicillin-binding protein 2 [Arcanobacterium wilhelmae]MDP9800255.1 cell division protein FtsI (penicillin-binding protein 3) [Arcanobacterium wilhelmae]WFN89694.1 penicillin-binding protein 2 [Arcanobacterium wilhelmae]
MEKLRVIMHGLGRRIAGSESFDTPEERTTYSRFRRIVAFVLALLLILVSRLFYLQVVVASDLADTAREFRTRSYTQEAKRGDILDANGAVLATSIERYNVRVNQPEIATYVKYDDAGEIVGTGAAAAAKELAPILKMDRAELGGILIGGEKKTQWGLVAKDISPEKWREINALGIRGIYPERFMQRSYPNGDVAGTVLGYVGQTADSHDVAGRAGIEQTMDSTLAGKSGSLTIEVGPAGTVFPQGTNTSVPAVDGGDVKLTIDRDLQKVAQEAIQDSVDRFGAKWGAAVAVEIGTGRVIALADSHEPDPGNLAAADPDNLNSRAVSAVVEPGSTGKVMTFASAIDQKTVSPTSWFQVSSDRRMPNGEVIHDNDPHPTQMMTVAGILAVSYNSGLVQIGDTLDDKVRYDYMRKFGLGSPTGIELPGESKGILREYTTWGKREHYTTMFGQGWAATPMQLAQMVSIIGNGGVKVPLHIVDGTYDRDGKFTPKPIGKSQQVISKDSAATMIKMMEAVTQKGSTAPLARVEGYNVAGKTGTAQVPDASGKLTRRVGTFVGLIPSEQPQIAVAVAVSNQPAPGYGSDVAAPVFSKIASFAMRQRQVPPSTVPLTKFKWTKAD